MPLFIFTLARIASKNKCVKCVKCVKLLVAKAGADINDVYMKSVNIHT